MPARFAVSLIKKLLFIRHDKESINENSIVIIAVTSPKEIVLKDRVSNSIEKPF